MAPEELRAVRTAFVLRDLGHSIDTIVGSPFIPSGLAALVREELEADEAIILTPARLIVADQDQADWLRDLDRTNWIYWPALRQYLLGNKGWHRTIIRELDDSSDRVLRRLAPPWSQEFDIRGLVLGFVQSGKTASFTAVIAKAADAGYRLVVVLSGIDKGLRRQTNIRLKRELVGYSDGRDDAVRLPPVGRQWHEFTNEDLDGDFRPGLANHAALQGSQPVLIVAKKNGPVLRRLLHWLEEAPIEVRRALPFLLIDDEADLASVDTQGSLQAENDPPDPDYEPPSVINGLIRELLGKFDRKAYVAYTATPFANILIPHHTSDPLVGSDLYPKDFIIDLPKPTGYFGAEEIFGRMDSPTADAVGGMDAIRNVPQEDITDLEHGVVPASLDRALIDFILAGAARAHRGDATAPATMLIHTSHRVLNQAALRVLVSMRFAELRDEWRYQRTRGIRNNLAQRWESEFRPVIRSLHVDRDVPFESIETHIGAFVEAVRVMEINSATGEVLDYEREPSLKAIAIGGNRLSRGLTLEGLLISYFVRRSPTYDTLMQMGRWFGFREGYEDVTRIWTTAELAGWFSDLALVEHRLREDLAVYEEHGLTPLQVGMRILQHPTMQVTSALKRRFAGTNEISQSYSLGLEQTFKFPLSRMPDLVKQAAQNRQSVIGLVAALGQPSIVDPKGPIWTGVSAEDVLDFLRRYSTDTEASSISPPLICAYIEQLNVVGELVRWTIGIRGLGVVHRMLGTADWGLPTGPVAQVRRTRLGVTDSVGVIVDPPDEALGLASSNIGLAARAERPPEEGLLVLYPISRYSGHESKPKGARRPLYSGAEAAAAPDLVGLAISFPASAQPQTVRAYLEGTVGWRPVE